MKKEALSDRRVQNLLKKYVLLKLKRSNKTEVKKLESFDGNIPSLFFMRPNGEIVDSIVGYYTREDFLGYIREIESEGF